MQECPGKLPFVAGKPQLSSYCKLHSTVSLSSRSNKYIKYSRFGAEEPRSGAKCALEVGLVGLNAPVI